jgi:hypothetical protein
MPGEQRRHDTGDEEGSRQACNDGPLDAVTRPPQLVPANKQPPQAQHPEACVAACTPHDDHLIPLADFGVALSFSSRAIHIA